MYDLKLMRKSNYNGTDQLTRRLQLMAGILVGTVAA